MKASQTFPIAALLVFVVLLASLHWLTTVSVSFILGFLIAYLCLPLVRLLTCNGCNPSLASFLVLLLVITVIALIILLPLPLLERQVGWLLIRLPSVMQTLEGWFNPVLRLFERQQPGIGEILFANWQDAGTFLHITLGWLLRSGGTLAGFIVILFLTSLLMFYFMRDWDHVFASLYRLLPERIAPAVAVCMCEADRVLGTFLRGQLLVIVSLAVLYSTGLWLAGLELALVIGVFAGVFSLIPYLGAVVGIVLASLANFLQGGDWLQFGYILAVFVIVQLLESFVLIPYLIGDHLGLHPLAVLFALVIGSSLFGLAGALFALPVLTVLVALLRRMLKSSLVSD